MRLNEFVDHLISSLSFEAISDSSAMHELFDIVGDPVALRRIFDNLLEKARRYGEGKIYLKTQLTPDSFQVHILDDGPGIPSELLDSIFEPFQRIESSRNRLIGSTGLGLGIAKAIGPRTRGIATIGQ